MTAHANCTHPATKAARAACRKLAAADAAHPGVQVTEIEMHGLFILDGTTYRVIGKEFGYVQYQDANLPIPVTTTGCFTELRGGTVVRKA